MRKIIASLSSVAIAAMTLVAGQASATSPAFTLQPFVYNPGNACPGITAKWDNTTGNPSPSIFLNKPCPTATNAASGVDIITPLEGQPVSNITELNFDYKIGGHCGAGAPRFNLQLDPSGLQNAFLGCAGGIQTPITSDPAWMHVEFTQAQIQAAVLAAGGSPTSTLYDLYIIFDEGTDTPSGGTIGTPGAINIDNISVNNQVVGGPNVPKSKDDCKKDGYKNLQDNNGQPFRNQGQCVSYFNHQ